ncbi:hypothetical protein [Deinococcus sp. Leaf326]|uniref:hypothetical protein n=1 Tax=Deinococcus sp. Leaf326 TaxID=1736338 RepID=UPI0006F6DE1F|nr:hypothetical protein [Deinococcus sp. Leaf326]KQR15734.1 hypothetical protein ASF71_08955 [Deinococcus sp. Leaf326]
MVALTVVALLMAVIAFAQAREALRRADETQERLARLEAAHRALLLRLRPPPEEEAQPVNSGAPGAAPPPAADLPPVWPGEAPPRTPRPRPPRPGRRGSSALWAPEYSRARISVLGGALVLGGLAFTLRALGLPGWTLLLAVFAFGGLLYATARLVPWPVSGALRGLGYGVTALGLGGTAQRLVWLPGPWGPAAALLGLLALSAALVWDSRRRDEPLLGALAVGGAALSVWMLADDLGRWSIPAAGLTLVLAAAAVWPRRETGEAQGPGAGATPGHDAALALTLGVAGAVPVGWAAASFSHLPAWGRDSLGLPTLAGDPGGRRLIAEVLLLSGPAGPQPWALAFWVGFGVLALAPALTLLRTRQADSAHGAGPLPLAVGWATLAPQVLTAAAVGTVLELRPLPVAATGLALAVLGALVGAAAWAWRTGAQPARRDLGEASLPGALRSALTAGASAVAGAGLLALTGPRGDAAALASLGLALLALGTGGRSRLWLRVGAGVLVASALWSAPAGGWTATVPALLGLTGALRLGADRWTTRPRPARPEGPASAPVARPVRPRLSAPLLAGLCSAALALSLPPLWPALLGTLALGAGLWTLRRLSPGLFPGRRWSGALRRTLWWAGAPGTALGALGLLVWAGDHTLRWPALLGSAVAALSLLATRRSAGRARPWAEAAALALLVPILALALVAGDWGAALALVALLAATRPLRLGRRRADILLGLGAVSTLLFLTVQGLTDHVPETGPRLGSALGPVLGLAVWALTRTPGGQTWLGRQWPGARGALAQLPPPAQPARALWLAGWLALLPLVALLWPGQDAGPWLTLSSLALLGTGLAACLRARAGHHPEARALWTAGLGLMAAAGVKAAVFDALSYSRPGVAAGLAVLVSGLSLLLVAVFAPRPAAAPAEPDDAPRPERPQPGGP